MTTKLDYIAIAKSLAPNIRDRARETEGLRRIHPETFSELKDSGIFTLCVPEKWGGPGADLATLYQTVEIISNACMSTGWITAFLIGHNAAAAKMPLKAQEEVFANGYGLLPNATAPQGKTRKATNDAGEEGWIVSGTAPWASGIMEAEWVLMTMPVEGDVPRNFLIPVDQIKVDDVWHYSGMAGTGSNNMTADEVFVPDYRTLSAAEMTFVPSEGAKLHDNPVYSLSFVVFACCQILGVVTGGLEAMAQEYQEIVTKRVRNFSGAVVQDQQATHIHLGEALMAARVAKELAAGHIAETDRLMREGQLSIEDRAHLKAHASYIAQHCLKSANQIVSWMGASNFHLDGVAQRHHRDITMVSNHAFWDADIAKEQLGRITLGLMANNPII